jgi:phosphoserine phosphatase
VITTVFLTFSHVIVRGSGLNAGPIFMGRGDIYENLWKMFMSGSLSGEEIIRSTLRLWNGIRIEDFPQMKARYIYTSGVRETLPLLKQRGITLVMVSNIPRLFSRLFANELGIDFVSGAEMEIQNGRLNGEIAKWTVSKGEVVRKFREYLGVNKKECLAVGDSRLDIPMFKEVGVGVAFTEVHDDPQVRKATKYSIHDFRELPSIVEKESKQE